MYFDDVLWLAFGFVIGSFVKGKRYRAVFTTLLIVAVAFAIFILEQPANATDASQTDKSDTYCAGNETAGRCADKCPQGSYQIGNDENTGAAVCKPQPNGCPYGDSIPLDSPKCAPPETPTEVLKASSEATGK